MNVLIGIFASESCEMACVKPDGSLTSLGEKALVAIATQACTPHGLAGSIGKPVYQARSICRELNKAGLVAPVGEKYEATVLGLGKLQGE